MSGLFGKRRKLPAAGPTTISPVVKEVQDTSEDRLRIMKELRKRRHMSIFRKSKQEEPIVLRRRLGGS